MGAHANLFIPSILNGSCINGSGNEGSKVAKEKLCKNRQLEDQFKHFQEIWNLRERHLWKDVHFKYIFCLSCCFKEGCIHPLCQKGAHSEEIRWYPGGPGNEHC